MIQNSAAEIVIDSLSSILIATESLATCARHWIVDSVNSHGSFRPVLMELRCRGWSITSGDLCFAQSFFSLPFSGPVWSPTVSFQQIANLDFMQIVSSACNFAFQADSNYEFWLCSAMICSASLVFSLFGFGHNTATASDLDPWFDSSLVLHSPSKMVSTDRRWLSSYPHCSSFFELTWDPGCNFGCSSDMASRVFQVCSNPSATNSYTFLPAASNCSPSAWSRYSQRHSIGFSSILTFGISGPMTAALPMFCHFLDFMKIFQMVWAGSHPGLLCGSSSSSALVLDFSNCPHRQQACFSAGHIYHVLLVPFYESESPHRCCRIRWAQPFAGDVPGSALNFTSCALSSAFAFVWVPIRLSFGQDQLVYSDQ